MWRFPKKTYIVFLYCVLWRSQIVCEDLIHDLLKGLLRVSLQAVEIEQGTHRMAA